MCVCILGLEEEEEEESQKIFQLQQCHFNST